MTDVTVNASCCVSSERMALLDEMAAALRRVEWDSDGYCSDCGGLREEGHGPDCPLSDVLARYKGEAE